jgi:integrase
VRLEGDETKNKQAQTIHLDPECKDVFKREWERRKKLGTDLPYVFLNRSGTDRVKRFDKAWNSACQKTGIRGRIFHDLRRTAVRNMVRRGIPERVAMQISGHKTRSVVDRYNIVSDKDLQHAAELMTQGIGTELGTEQGSERKVLPINV